MCRRVLVCSAIFCGQVFVLFAQLLTLSNQPIATTLGCFQRSYDTDVNIGDISVPLVHHHNAFHNIGLSIVYSQPCVPLYRYTFLSFNYRFTFFFFFFFTESRILGFKQFSHPMTNEIQSKTAKETASISYLGTSFFLHT